MLTRRLLPFAALAAGSVAFAFVSPTAHAGSASPFVKLSWPNAHGATGLARYGSVVAPAGDVNGDGYSDVLVGAPKEEGPNTDSGRVYLFLGSKNGLAAAPAWSWSANQAQGATGTSVAAAGDLNGDGFGDVVVGTPGWIAPGNVLNAGKISIFHGAPSGLPATPTTERTAPTPTAQAKYGWSVATAGNVNGDAYDDLVVGAPFHTSGGLTARGVAYVYHGGATGLGAAPSLTVLGASAGANQGKAVSPAGDVDADGFADVLIGAPHAQFQGQPAGIAALHRGSAGGVIAAPDTVIGGDQFDEECGAAVANAGDLDGDGHADVLVGSPGWSSGDLHWGRYQILRGGPGGLQSPPVLAINGQNPGERLGAALATLGDLNADGYADFAIAAPADSGGGSSPYVHVFFGGLQSFQYGSWVELRSDAPQAQFFGFSIATAGDVDGDGRSEFFVGDPNDSFAEGAMEGTATLFALARSVPRLTDDGPNQSNDFDSRRGASVAITPALDGSGIPRSIVGEPGYPIGSPNWGITLAFRGVGFGFNGQFGSTAGEQFGARVADAGDVDGDNFSDVVVSSPTFSGPGGSEVGRVSLWRGKGAAPFDPPTVVLEGTQAQAHVGSALAARGDVNGDGAPDILIGARDWDEPGLTDCGKVWIVYGDAGAGAPGAPGGPAPIWSVTGSVPGEGLGASVAFGDLDGDGFGDVIVGSVSPLSVSPPVGRVQVFYGGVGGPSTTPAWQLTSNVPSPTFGAALAAGDVNGDDEADLLVGAPGENGLGRVFLFPGERGRGRPASTWWRGGTQAGSRFGAVLAAGGDIDGDGIGDFVVGEPMYDGVVSDAGRVHVYYGHRFEPVAAWNYAGNSQGLQFGASVAPLNDLNLDGFADLVIGAPWPGPSGRGYVYTFHGGGVNGLKRAVTLRDGGFRRFRPARIGAFDPFFLAYTLRSPEGRARLRQELEVIPHGEPFTEATAVTPAVDTGPAVPGVGSVVDQIEPLSLPWQGTAYKVRTRTRSTSPFFPGSPWLRPEAHRTGDFDVLRGGAEVDVPSLAGGVPAPRIARIAPNPVVGDARIAYALPRASRVTIDVHDVRGARVRRLVDGERPGGVSIETWDGRDDAGRATPSGIYFVRLSADGVEDGARLVRLP